MLLRTHHARPATLIGAGQLALAAGLVLHRFVHPAADLWQGFVAGLGGVLIGFSLVLNLTGLVRSRRAPG